MKVIFLKRGKIHNVAGPSQNTVQKVKQYFFNSLKIFWYMKLFV